MGPIGRRCAYQKLDSGIREFIFLEKSQRAVDEWIGHLDRIMLHDPPQDGVKELLLMDVRQHVPGAVYAAQKLHAWRRENDPDDDNTRTAILLNKQSEMVMSIADSIIRIVGMERITLRFFYHDRQKAVDWLLSEK